MTNVPARGWLLVVLGVGVLASCSSSDDDDNDAASAGRPAAGGTSSGGAGKPASGGSAGTEAGGSAGKPAAGSAGKGGNGTGATGGTGIDPAGGANDGATGGSGGNGGSGGKGGTAGKGGSAGQGGSSTGSSRAAEVAEKLGRDTNFLVGMGNDLNNDHNQDGAYTLGVTMDIHYAYLVGLPGEGGWPDWNADGSFVNILADSADAHGTTPMYTEYGMAAHGEGNAAVLTDADYMSKYWAQAKLLHERLALFDKPAIVHHEPDFWAFYQQQTGGDPSKQKVLIHDYVPECSDEPEDLSGFGHCLIKLSRSVSPKVIIGFHASQWAGSPSETVKFLNACGADGSDYIAIDMLDRDAGCFEAATDPNCMRGGTFYWDESNQTSPNFHEFLDFSKQISDGLNKPVIWWQIPFGVPSDTPGGTAGHYRDNRVHYIFSHVDEFIDAGGLGAAFGVGAGNQTFIDTDGGQFQDAVTSYFADPAPLP
jgi:hypothetical protein